MKPMNEASLRVLQVEMLECQHGVNTGDISRWAKRIQLILDRERESVTTDARADLHAAAERLRGLEVQGYRCLLDTIADALDPPR